MAQIYEVQFEINSTQVAFTLKDAQLAIPADGPVFAQYRVTGGGNGVRVNMVGGQPRIQVDNSAGGITRLTLPVTLTGPNTDRFFVFWDVPATGAGQYLRATVNGTTYNITNHEDDPVIVQ